MKVKTFIVGILLALSSLANSYGADWCVQVSAFRNLEAVKQDLRKLKTHKHTRVEKLEDIYFLRVGHFDTAAHAKETLKSIKVKFPGAFIRKCANEPKRIVDLSKTSKPQIKIIPSEPPAARAASSSSPPMPASGIDSGRPQHSTVGMPNETTQASVVTAAPTGVKPPEPPAEKKAAESSNPPEQTPITASSAGPPSDNPPSAPLSAALAKVEPTPAAAKVSDPVLQTSQEARKTDQPIPMSLAEAVALNLRRNVDIKIAYMDRVQQKYDFVTDYYYAYQPRVSASLSETRSFIEDTDELTGVTAKKTTRSDNANVKAVMKLPTGTEFTFLAPQWNETKTTYEGAGAGSVDYMSRTKGWGVSFTQPLLKGAGIDYHTAAPKIAKMREDVNKLTLKNTVSSLVRRIIQDYRSFLSAKWSVEIYKASLKRSLELLEINKFQIELGTMAPEDMVQTEADVANNQLQLEDALNSYDKARINLLIDLDMNKETLIEPVESLDTKPFLLDEERCLALLFENQPGYLTTLLNLEMYKLNAMMARRDSLWELNLTGSYGTAASKDDSITTENKKTDSGIGLTLNVPIYGSDARALKSAVLHAENNVKKAELNLRKLKSDIILVVRDKVRNIRILQKKIEMAGRAYALALRKLENEKVKLVAGRSSNFQLTTYQDQLTVAQSNQLQAQIDYLNALTDLDDYLGTTTDTWNIDINDDKREEGPLLKSTPVLMMNRLKK